MSKIKQDKIKLIKINLSKSASYKFYVEGEKELMILSRFHLTKRENAKLNLYIDLFWLASGVILALSIILSLIFAREGPYLAIVMLLFLPALLFLSPIVTWLINSFHREALEGKVIRVNFIEFICLIFWHFSLIRFVNKPFANDSRIDKIIFRIKRVFTYPFYTACIWIFGFIVPDAIHDVSGESLSSIGSFIVNFGSTVMGLGFTLILIMELLNRFSRVRWT